MCPRRIVTKLHFATEQLKILAPALSPSQEVQRLARSAAPRFHTSTWQIRRMLETGYRSYRDAYRDAMNALQGHSFPVRFPSHGIPPPLRLATTPT